MKQRKKKVEKSKVIIQMRFLNSASRNCGITLRFAGCPVPRKYWTPRLFGGLGIKKVHYYTEEVTINCQQLRQSRVKSLPLGSIINTLLQSGSTLRDIRTVSEGTIVTQEIPVVDLIRAIDVRIVGIDLGQDLSSVFNNHCDGFSWRDDTQQLIRYREFLYQCCSNGEDRYSMWDLGIRSLVRNGNVIAYVD